MLEGIRVIEIEAVGPAPFAGMLLADLGADVIVVHRRDPPALGSAERSILDRGKRSIILDLKNETDISVLQRMIATADGLIEGFRPGVMERLGVGPDEARKIQPGLVYGRLTGWGQDGPKAPFAGHDLNYIALSGALWYASHAEDAPYTPPTAVGDIGGGAMYLVTGMLAALIRAQRSGRGSVVDAAIVDGSAHTMNLLMAARSAGLVNDTRGTSTLDGSPWSRCYATADGKWLSVQCLEPKFYALLREKLGVAEDDTLRQDADPNTWNSMTERFATIFSRKTQQDWSKIFEDCDACVAPVLAPSQAAVHAHMAARGTWIEVDGQLQARAAPRFDGEQPESPAIAPTRGQHTDEILASLDSAQ